MWGLSLVVASRGHSALRCAGLSLSRPLLLRSTDSRRAGSVVVAHGPSCSAACGIFPDQGSTPCPLHWQADSQPLRHQGSPNSFFNVIFIVQKLICLWLIYFWNIFKKCRLKIFLLLIFSFHYFSLTYHCGLTARHCLRDSMSWSLLDFSCSVFTKIIYIEYT